MKQQLDPGGFLEIPSAKELKEAVGHEFSAYLRDVYRGMKLMRMPISRTVATGATLTVGANQGGDVAGPDQGYIWRIARIMVASNSLTDTAKYTLYTGSDITATDSIHLIDGQLSPVNNATPAVATPAVPASTVAVQNPNNFAVQVVISGGTLTAVVVNGVTVGTTAGTYFVPAYGAISITYTVAPTWAWSAAITVAATPLGQNVNIAFRPGNKSEWVFAGEQLYAAVSGATSGNTYTMTGIVAEVPAEMIGKIL